jgi:UDP-2,3-diacylglucosamine hydrolase
VDGPPTLFISDLHLAPSRPGMMSLFLRFLEEKARAAAALYILGDLFEYWIGDDDPDNLFNESVLGRLASLAEHDVPVFFMPGNRDFLLGSRAAARGRLRLLTEPSVIDLYGERTLLLHGDTLCTDDLAYQRYRRLVRNPLFSAAARVLPLNARHRIGKSVRAYSEQRAPRGPIGDVTDKAVYETFRRYQVRQMIHGHTHRAARHDLAAGGERYIRWVLPDWYERGGYLHASAQSIELAAFA